MAKKQRVLFQKSVSIATGLLLVFQSLTPGFFVASRTFAQEATPTETPAPTVVPTPEPTIAPTEIVTPTPTEEVTPTIEPTPTEIPTPTEAISPTVTPTVTQPEPTKTEPPKETGPPADDKKGEILDGATTDTPAQTPTPTITPVQPETGEIQATILKNVKSDTLDLDGVNPDGSARLSTDKADYAPTDTAIITGTDFTPGKTYQLTISSTDKEPTSTTVDVTADDKGTFIYAYQLDGHYRPNYTVKVITKNDNKVIDSITFTDSSPTVHVSNLQPSWTATDGGGVFAAYVGPPAYGYVSPGTTELYDGREAGIIKAGLTVDPGSGHYEDEGLFGFIPTITIDTLATATLTYDVENQEGTNPVWMTIEIDTGVADDRSDNTTYQFVPTTNPSGWHTVDAAAGQWQKWNNNDGDTSGNPLISLSTIATAHTGKNVIRVYLRLGMGDSYHGSGAGTVAWIDKITIERTTYDFVLAGKIYWCHCEPNGNCQTLYLPPSALENAGHMNADGNPLHAGDYAGECTPPPTPTPIPPTPTPIPPTPTPIQTLYCGDGIKNNQEQCDGTDGVTPGTNFCTNTCTLVPIYNGSSACPQGTNKKLISSTTISSTESNGQTLSLGGGTYLFEATGTYVSSSGGNWQSDAGYSSNTNWASYDSNYGIHGIAPNYGAHALLANLGSGVGIVNWGDYNTGHTYGVYTTTTANPKFLIGDRYSNWYGTTWDNQAGMFDNSGNLTLNVYECAAPKGTIEIRKIISPADSSTFWNFGIDAGYTFWDTWKTNGYSSGPIEITPGNHSVVEQTAPGTDGTKYSSSFVCKDGETVVVTGGPASLVYGQNLVSTEFNVASDQHIICTFTNTKKGTIEIKKIISPADTTNWNFGIDAGYTFWDTGKTNGYTSGQIGVVPGRHSVVEQVGYNGEPINGFTDGNKYSSTLVCKDGETTVATGGPATLPYGTNLVSNEFDVASDQHIVCTFTNSRLGSTSGQKYNDLDGDGQKDAGEPGLQGWEIRLYNETGNGLLSTTTTDAQGNYIFSNRLPGNYQVCEIAKTGWTNTDPGAGAASSACKSVSISSNGNTIANFGNFKLGYIQGRKFNDLNGNGQEDSGEPVINNWPIRLYDASWNSVAPEQTTHFISGSGNGRFRFENLNIGTYYVCEVLQSGWIQTDPGNTEGFLNQSGITGEAPRCRKAVINQSGQRIEGKIFGNTQYGSVTVTKYHDLDEDGEKDVDEPYLPGWEMTLSDYGVTTTNADGLAQFSNVLAGTYQVGENMLPLWKQTDIDCSTNQPTTTPTPTPPPQEELNFLGVEQIHAMEARPKNQITVTPGETVNCSIGNHYSPPVLQISKQNDAGGDKTPGASVMYTIAVQALDNPAYRINVTDLLPKGFVYRSGSWTAVSSTRGALALTEPTYASPGTWSIGRIDKGEIITLTLIADISGDEKPGLYKDVALAYGCTTETVCGIGGEHSVIAEAVAPGKLDTTFVGTQVNIVKDQYDGRTFNVEHEETGTVLGASTELPSTGANANWIIVALSFIITGLGALVVSSKMRRYHA